MNDSSTSGDSIVRNVRQEKKITVIDLSGQIDMNNVMELRGALLESLHDNPEALIVNMKGVSFMDSSGLATLVEGLQLCKKRNRRLILAALQPQVKNVFEIARLDKLFSIVASEEEALAL